MKLVADSHAVLWYTQGSGRLSERAASALTEAEATDGVIVSVVSLLDLWDVTQTTKALTEAEVSEVRATIVTSPAFVLQPVDLAIVDATTAIPSATCSPTRGTASSSRPPKYSTYRWSPRTRRSATAGSCRPSGEIAV